MFSKSNNKFQQKISGNGLENKQRRELKMKRFDIREKNKENPKKIDFEKASKFAEQKLKKNLKVFKRSK